MGLWSIEGDTHVLYGVTKHLVDINDLKYIKEFRLQSFSTKKGKLAFVYEL